MQIVAIADNFHEISNPVLGKVKVLQALHHVPPLHLHQANAMLCPFTFLQGFKKISETVFKF